MKSIFSSLLLGTLVPFSLSSMEKEKPIQIHDGIKASDSEEDRNADLVVKAFLEQKPISEINNLLNTRNINFNYHVKLPPLFPVNTRPVYNHNIKEIFTILRCTLEYCDPNKEEDVKLVKRILKDTNLIKQHPSGDWEPYLLFAINKATQKNNDLSIVKLLVRQGADINLHFAKGRLSPWGISALHCALVNFDNDTKCIDYLLKKGADANARSTIGHYIGYTPLAILATRLEYFNKLKINFPDIWESYLKQFELAVEKLIENGAKISKSQVIPDDNRDRSRSILQEALVQKNNYILKMKNNYDLLKPFMPNLDTIIKRAKDKKKKIESEKKYSGDLKNALTEKLPKNHQIENRLLHIRNQKFSLHEPILSTRCPNLCLELNHNYKKEEHPQFKPSYLYAPLVKDFNAYKQAALLIGKKKSQTNYFHL
jgi:ankyrin repeat protein